MCSAGGRAGSAPTVLRKEEEMAERTRSRATIESKNGKRKKVTKVRERKGWSAQVLQRWLRAQVGGCRGKTVKLGGRRPRPYFVNRRGPTLRWLQTVCIAASKLCPSLIRSPGIHSDFGAPSSDLAPWAAVGICPSSILSNLHRQNPLPRNPFHGIFRSNRSHDAFL